LNNFSEFSIQEKNKLLLILLLSSLVAVLPILYACLILKNQGRLTNPVLEKRFGALWKDLKTKEAWALVFFPIFMARRLFFVFIVVYLRNHS